MGWTVKLFLDACALIYRFEGTTAFRAATTVLLAQLTRNQPSVELAVSRLSVLECRVESLREGDTATLAAYEAFFASVQILELSPAVVDLATYLRARHGIKTPDALQAACALEWDTGAIFVTGDGAFSKLEPLDVRVIQAPG